MIGRRPGLLLVALLFATVPAGCTSVSSGDPQPVALSTTSSEDTSTTAPPTRPREIHLDDVDPCTLLPPADYSEFKLADKPGKPGKDAKGGNDCTWQGKIGYANALLVTYEGVEAQVGRFGQIAPTDPIDDFPTYTVTLPNEEETCAVVVDVADGQNLNAQLGLDFAPTDRPACDYAHDFATSLMSTLVKR
jgi:hypothetical protein